MTAPWPLFDLRIGTAHLELRAPTDEDLMGLVALAGRGIHDAAEITEKLGYRLNGIDVVAPRGEPVEERRYRLLREDWRPELYPTTIEGLEGCLDMFVGPSEDQPTG